MWFNNLCNIYTGNDAEPMKRTNAKMAKMKNNVIFMNTLARLFQDGLHRYHFEGLPDSVSERVLKESLMIYGSAVFFVDDGNILCLPGVPSGDGFNAYGDPANCWVFARNGKLNKNVKTYLPGSDEAAFLKETTSGRQSGEVKGVFIRENATCYPFINHTIFYSDVIADTFRTLDVARLNMKSPFIITAEEAIVNSVKEFFKHRDNNETYVVSTGVFPSDKVSLLPFETNADNLTSATQLIDWYENKYRELCGVENNGQIDKKGENLIQSEIDINDQYTDNSVDKCIEYIQKGLDDVNKLFGTNIRVVPNRKEREENVFEDQDLRSDDRGE